MIVLHALDAFRIAFLFDSFILYQGGSPSSHLKLNQYGFFPGRETRSC